MTRATELMKELNFPSFNLWGYELMEAFYHAAQAEAFEAVAKRLDNTARYKGTDVSYYIREMAKEKP